MSRWTVEFKSQNAMVNVQTCLGYLESVKLEGLSQQILEEYSRLLKVLNVLAVRFSKLDAELFNQGIWINLANFLTNTQNSIRGFSQNKDLGNLQNANNQVDQILNILKPLDSGSTAEEFNAIADASAIFQQKIVEEMQRVKVRGEEIKGQLDALSNAITQSKARLDEHGQTIQQQKTRLDQSIAEYQKQFSEAQEKRSKDFADSGKKYLDDFVKQSKSFDNEFAFSNSKRQEVFDLFFMDTKITSQKHLAFLKQREEEVNKIFGAIGSTAFAGNFKNTADKEASAANLWRWIAMTMMVFMIAVSGFAFYFSIVEKTDWTLFLFRLGTVVVFGVPAFYAANESSKHRERERLNSKVHLELASIDAYLVLLPENERNKIKGGLTEKFFGVPLLKEKGDEITQHDLFGVLTNVLTNLTKK